MSKYSYMVNPRIPLKLNGEVIRRSKYVDLDKEEVKYALKHGPVYRKFDAQTTERVTLQNLDELHVEKKGVPVVKVEEVVTPIQDPVKDENVKVSEGETPVDDTVKDEETSAIEQVAKDIVTEETPVEGEEEVTVEDVVTEETPVEGEEVKEETPVEETTAEEQKQPQNNNYYRKKKRNR